MTLSILNNISALAAQNQLSVTQAGLQKTLQQLSSGSRINSGADDSAGLSIANSLHANVAALTQSSRNASDAVGLLQTADGAAAQVTAMLYRAITLATEASNGVINSAQATALNTEFQSILTEINRVGSDTTFNGQQVFTDNDVTPFLSDGTAGNNLLSGATMTIGELDSSTLLGTGTPATSATDTLTLTANVVDGGTVQIGSQTYTFRATASSNGEVQIGANAAATLSNLATAIAGDAHNTNNADVTASVSGSGNNASISFTAKTSGTGGNGITVNSSLTAAASTSSTGTWSNGGALGGGTDGQNSLGMLKLTNAQNGDTVTIGGVTYAFKNSINNAVANEVLIAANDSDTESNLACAISGKNFLGTGSGVRYSSATSVNATVQADPYWVISSFGNNARMDFYGTPSDLTTGLFGSVTGSSMSWTSKTAGTAAVAATETLNLTSNLVDGSSVRIGSQTYQFTSGTVGSGQVAIGSNALATLQNLAGAISGDTNNTGNTSAIAAVSGTSNNATITLTAIPFSASVSAFANDPIDAGNGVVATGTLLTSSPGGGSVGTWSNSGSLAGGIDGSGGASLDLNTAENAQTALLALNSAVSQLAQKRGNLGACINQLEAATSVMNTQSQNLSSAESNITDADMALTVANMMKYNILQSTGIAALQQSSQMQQALLKLLQ